ncbi:MAG: ABC transporter permease, partial [Peptococcus niger]
FMNRFYANNANFKVMSQSVEQAAKEVNSVLSSVKLAISVIAGISLLVGGIGVMNIMLVSVTERTREIGVRKALGATNFDIRIQFIVESMIVCLIGGIIGILFGGLFGFLGSLALKAATGPSLFSIIIATGFSMLIGVFFGYYPANKAAQLDPIDALRYE